MIEVHEQHGSSGNSPVKQHQESPTRQETPIEYAKPVTTHHRSQNQELPEPYDFRAPDKVDGNRLNNKFGKAAEFVEKRINVLTKIASELLEGEEKTLDEEVKLIERAVNFIDENIGAFKELLDKEHEQKVKLEEHHNARMAEFQVAQSNYDHAREKIREVEDVIKQQAKELVEKNAQKEAAADRIAVSMGAFKKVSMREPQDQGHELFKWFLGVIYNESNAKYEFENFKKEVLKKDKGQDFIQRLKGFRAFGIGKEEVAHTNKIVTLEKEVTERINPKNKEPLATAVKDAFAYIDIIRLINLTMEDMHKREVDLEAAAKKVDLSGAELDKLRSRKNDAETGLQIANKAIQTFANAHKLFASTAQRCRERQKYISETLPNIKKSVKPKKTEVIVEAKGGEQEETAFGTVNQEAVKKQPHKQVRATYESDINELPPTQKEGCKCTIF